MHREVLLLTHPLPYPSLVLCTTVHCHKKKYLSFKVYGIAMLINFGISWKYIHNFPFIFFILKYSKLLVD